MTAYRLTKAIIISVALLFANPSASQQTSDIPFEAQQILRQTLAENGYLTEAMHTKFWRIVRSLGTSDEIETGITFLRGNIDLTQAVQRATWESTLLSWQAEEIIRTASLEMLTENFDKFMLEHNPFPKGSRQNSEFTDAFEAEYRNSMQSIDAFLIAAAKRQQYVETQNGMIPLSKSMIERVLTNMEASFGRLDRLLNPTWNDVN